MAISEQVRGRLVTFQKNEITEHHIYRKLAGAIRSPENRRVLEKIAADELRHYYQWKTYTGQDAAPGKIKIWLYYWIGRLLGYTFAVKLMERGEKGAQENYAQLISEVPEAVTIAREEDEHEAALLEMLDEERLRYTGSMVLGLNDALVELTGALAGLTLALQNTKLIALTGSITGIAAAMSMAASEYLSTKADGGVNHPVKASLYTGSAYIVTVLILIAPYLIFTNYYVCLACTMAAAVVIIALFNFYIAVAKDLPFKHRFFEMAGLSFAVAGFSFLVGFALRKFLGIEV